MKTQFSRLIPPILLAFVLTNTFSQTYYPVTIYTPNGSAVSAGVLTSQDYTSKEKKEIKDYWLDYYDYRITYLAEATRKYNCHAYAWYISEVGSLVWLETPGDDAFWDDCSYFELLQSLATKVSFGGPCVYYSPEFGYSANWCDHSAITTSETNIFKSKWGPACRFKHSKDDCPYDPQDLHFYVRASVSGNNLICTSNQTYYIAPIMPPNSTASWIFNPGYLVTPYSGSGSSATVQGSCSYHGNGKITFTITPSGCNSYQVKKENIIVIGPDPSEVELDILYSSGQPAPKPYGMFLLCPNTTYHIYLMNNSICSTSNYIWTIPSGWTKFYQYNNMISINTNSQPGGQIMVDATTCCPGCGSVRILIDYVGQYWDCGGGYFMASPNPADDYLNIDVNMEKMTADGISIENEYILTIVDKMGTVKYTTEVKEFPHRINTRNLPEGLYIINLMYEGKINSIKVMIEH